MSCIFVTVDQLEQLIFSSPEYDTPSYKVKFDVTYNLDTLASKCVGNFGNILATYNTTIAKKIDALCSLLNPGNFVINSVSSTSLTFKVCISYFALPFGMHCVSNKERKIDTNIA